MNYRVLLIILVAVTLATHLVIAARNLNTTGYNPFDFDISESAGQSIINPSKSSRHKLSDSAHLDEEYHYGVDYSYPIHHYAYKNKFFHDQYLKMMNGCYKLYSQSECDSTDHARVDMNYDQPRSQHNYTDIGFKHIKAPKSVMDPILAFYNKYKGQDVPERWPRGNVYVNHWDSPTTMISFENKNFRGGFDVKQQIWDAVKPIIEEWTGKKVVQTSLYGIRFYHDKAVLSPHVDRLPLVSSAIIQVDQDVDEDWPVEVYGRDGKAYNVTMKPGDMVLYESHTTIHGRPFPMKGRFYANIFCHFAPIDHDKTNEHDQAIKDELAARPPRSSIFEANKILHDTLKDARSHVRIGGHEQNNIDEKILLKYIEEDDEESFDEEDDPEDGVEGQTSLHRAAANGSVKKVQHVVGKKPTDIIHARDINGWQAIHEAARSGNTDVVKYLVSMGADPNAKTNAGESVLWWALKSVSKDDELIKFLEGVGAKATRDSNLRYR